jgi:hypothetical protein
MNDRGERWSPRDFTQVLRLLGVSVVLDLDEFNVSARRGGMS